MKIKTLALSALAMAVALPASTAVAANTDSHAVTVTVSAINEVAITGGAVSLTISTATAGSEPDAASDSATADLAWTTNEASKKITVESDLATPNFSLQVTAGTVSGGTSAGAVSVSNVATDFVTGIGTTVGSCDLEYSASATAADGTGSDAHTITYTLTDV